MSFEISALTHLGAVRTSNEDALVIDGKLISHSEFGPKHYEPTGSRCVLMLADGMGGHAQGALASKIALSSLIASSRRASSESDWLDAMERANDAVYDLMELMPSAKGMGSTVVGMLLDGTSLLHFNVGDSRAYLYSSGCLSKLTHDDVPVPLGSGSHRQSHQITQSLGGLTRRTGIRPHVGTIYMHAGDEVVLLCSDGLTDMVEDEVITNFIASIPDLDQCASVLFRAAMANGGHDNISIILARRGHQ